MPTPFPVCSAPVEAEGSRWDREPELSLVSGQYIQESSVASQREGRPVAMTAVEEGVAGRPEAVRAIRSGL